MPIHEWICSPCEIYVEKLEFGDEITRPHPCPGCEQEMTKIISLCRFELVYNAKRDLCDWHGNSSHYWDAVKKAREDGKDVKPLIDGDKY